MSSARGAFALASLAYGEAPSHRAWLQALLEPAERLIGRSADVNASLFRVDVPEAIRLLDFAGLPETLEGLAECLSVTTPEVRAKTFAAGPVILLSDRVPRHHRVWEVLRRRGCNQVAGMVCRDSGPIGCCVSFNLAEADPELTPRERRRFAQAAAHVASGLRLRLSTSSEAAVLATDGRLLDAQGEAKRREHREALRRAVRALDRAQLLAEREPERGLDAWRALVEGRWSLVERFDSDGRRHWIARENGPAARKIHRLTLAERRVLGYLAVGHSQKLIAYELGLSEPTISKHATAARTKLGIRTRAELVELYASLHGTAGNGESTSTA